MSAKYTVHYRGCDGSDKTTFASLPALARYLKGRDLGSDYRRPSGLQGEFAFFSFDGFGWSDVMEGNPFDSSGRYRSELLADIKLSFGERKLNDRSYTARAWNAKDGPEIVGRIELSANPAVPASPFMAFVDSNKFLGWFATLAEVKEAITAAYRESEAPPPAEAEAAKAYDEWTAYP